MWKFSCSSLVPAWWIQFNLSCTMVTAESVNVSNLHNILSTDGKKWSRDRALREATEQTNEYSFDFLRRSFGTEPTAVQFLCIRYCLNIWQQLSQVSSLMTTSYLICHLIKITGRHKYIYSRFSECAVSSCRSRDLVWYVKSKFKQTSFELQPVF